MLTFSVFGVFSVKRINGEDATPRSRKSCGLLALLLAAKGYRCSRESLMDKLWSDRSSDQARASLRTTLTEIRKAFGDEGESLIADMWHVSLNSEKIKIFKPSQGETKELYLDGIGIKDPEFENWLRDRRQEFEHSGNTNSSATSMSIAPILMLALPRADVGKSIFADYLKNSISKTVADWGSIDVRWEGQAGLLDPKLPIYRLDTQEHRVGDGIALQAQLTSHPDGTVLWQVTDIIPTGQAHNAIEDISRLTNSCVDQTVSMFAGYHARRLGSYHHTSFEVMQGMLASQGQAYDDYYKAFGKKFEEDGRGIHLAWQGFLACWAVGERHRRNLDEVRENARELMCRAIDLEPHNSVVYALASHIFGFVLSEYEVSGEMALRSVTLDKNNPLGWGFLAVSKLNMNRGAEAFENVMFARRICGEGPHRAFIDSLAVQIGTLTGNANEVFGIGESLCALRPKYSSPLRHLIAGYVATDQFQKAERCALSLRKNEPDFSLSLFLEPDYPVHALRESGVLDLKRLPKLL